jgi:hypothetical protein
MESDRKNARQAAVMVDNLATNMAACAAPERVNLVCRRVGASMWGTVVGVRREIGGCHTRWC